MNVVALLSYKKPHMVSGSYSRLTRSSGGCLVTLYLSGNLPPRLVFFSCCTLSIFLEFINANWTTNFKLAEQLDTMIAVTMKDVYRC